MNRSPRVDCAALAADLLDWLPEYARMRIDREDPRNARFFAAPDDPEEHKPDWHEFGIITHTRLFLEVFRGEMRELLARFGLAALAARLLDERVDGARKGDLLEVAVALHDIGKFSRTFYPDRNDPARFHPLYIAHEERSEAWILEEPVAGRLAAAGLTAAQASYVARAAGAHYVLGAMRDRIRFEGRAARIEYDLAFVSSPFFARLAGEIMAERPDLAGEIGVLYLADSLAKTRDRLEADTEEQAAAAFAAWRDRLAAEGRPLPRHAKAVRQLPTSVAAARRYLEFLRDAAAAAPSV